MNNLRVKGGVFMFEASMVLRDCEMLREEVCDLLNYDRYNVGVIFNALHYVRNAEDMLRRLAEKEAIM